MGSLWKKQRAGWHADSARTELRALLGLWFPMMGALTVVLLAIGVEQYRRPGCWPWLLGGAGMGLGALGIWACRPWGRWLAG